MATAFSAAPFAAVCLRLRRRIPVSGILQASQAARPFQSGIKHPVFHHPTGETPAGQFPRFFFAPEKPLDPLQLQHYQSLRKLGLAAGHALACSKQRIALHLKCSETGFAWAENRHGFLHASWQQEGFDLTAAVVNDEEGWWTSGVEYIGRFSRRWQPGAIRHRHGDRNACEWFVPANLGDPKQEYRLACTYGHDWWYVGVKVKASRAGVTLGVCLTSPV